MLLVDNVISDFEFGEIMHSLGRINITFSALTLVFRSEYICLGDDYEPSLGIFESAQNPPVETLHLSGGNLSGGILGIERGQSLIAQVFGQSPGSGPRCG